MAKAKCIIACLLAFQILQIFDSVWFATRFEVKNGCVVVVSGNLMLDPGKREMKTGFFSIEDIFTVTAISTYFFSLYSSQYNLEFKSHTNIL